MSRVLVEKQEKSVKQLLLYTFRNKKTKEALKGERQAAHFPSNVRQRKD